MPDDMNSARVVRRRALSDDQRDVPIFNSDGTQIDAVVAEIVWHASQNPNRERFEMVFRGRNHEQLEGLQFETLKIALDQAKAIAEIDLDQWEVISEPVVDDT